MGMQVLLLIEFSSKNSLMRCTVKRDLKKAGKEKGVSVFFKDGWRMTERSGRGPPGSLNVPWRLVATIFK